MSVGLGYVRQQVKLHFGSSRCKCLQQLAITVRHFEVSVRIGYMNIILQLILSLKRNDLVLCEETAYISYFVMAYVRKWEKVPVFCKYLLKSVH